MHDLKARVQPWAAGVDTQRVINARALGRALVGAGAAVLIAAAGSTARASVPVHIAGSDGHATHPVWYHDATAVQVGNRVDVSWTTNQASVARRAWGRVRGGWVQPGPTVFSSAVLDCGCTDSSGTNPNRHDVPTLFADPAGRVYALYGGGTASKVGGQTGPYFNAAPSADGTVPAASGETLLSVPGAAYDF